MGTPPEGFQGVHTTKAGGATPPPTRGGMVAKFRAVRQTGLRVVRPPGYTWAAMPECSVCRRPFDGRFKVMVHLGNYALWLAGLFPDYIAARQLRSGGPDLSYYDTLGRRGFELASDHALADHYNLETVFRSAAERYPEVRGALNDISERVFFPSGYLH